ncbi:hypothetical protein Tco_0276085 [Tanacetum coccineum]
MEKTYTSIEAKEVANNGAPNDHREGFDKFSKGSSWDNYKGRKKGRDRFSSYKGSNHGLLANLSKSSRENLATKKAAKCFKQPPRMVGRRPSCNMTKYCHFHKDHRHDTNQCLELRHQIDALNPSIKALRVDSNIPLVGFSGEHSWPLGECLPFMHIKFHTPYGIGTVTFTYESNKVKEGQKMVKETLSEIMRDVLRKQLPASFKKKLQDLLRSNTDVFAWTYADMTRILRTITVGGKPFITKHKLNEYKHIKPIKQKKRVLGPDRNEAACKEVDDLTKAGILRQVKDHTRMTEGDEDKTTFFTGKRVFCYRKMPFGLKNTRATYQRIVDKETFDRLRSINMKLNSKKCSFGIEEGSFLGHLINKQGIRSNPSKVKAVTDMEPPKTLKDVQSLNGKLAAQSRFLSKGAEKSLPFFKTLKSCKDKNTIRCSTNAEKAFQRMKELMEILPTLTASIKGKVLIIYLVALTESISAVLLAEREKRQVPIYFQTLADPEKSGRIAKWAIDLGEHDIEVKGRDSVKGQIPANFLVETPPTEDNEKEISKVGTKKEGAKLENMWKLYTDEALSSDGSGVGLMLISPEGKEYTYTLRLPADSQPSKGTIRSQTTHNKAISKKDERNLDGFRYLFNGAPSQKPEQESQHTKQVGFHDLRTSHQGSIGGSLSQEKASLKRYTKAPADLTRSPALW